MFHLIINPSYGFFAPHTFIQSNSHRAYPTIFSIWYDCPHYAPTQLIDYLENNLSYIWPDHAPIKFLKALQVFINDYFRLITLFLSSCYIFRPFFVIFNSFPSLFLWFIPFYSTNLHSTTSHSFPFISPPLPQNIQQTARQQRRYSIEGC